jgi:hypothetical protein
MPRSFLLHFDFYGLLTTCVTMFNIKNNPNHFTIMAVGVVILARRICLPPGGAKSAEMLNIMGFSLCRTENFCLFHTFSRAACGL